MSRYCKDDEKKRSIAQRLIITNPNNSRKLGKNLRNATTILRAKRTHQLAVLPLIQNLDVLDKYPHLKSFPYNWYLYHGGNG